jgi:hypothetical protein
MTRDIICNIDRDKQTKMSFTISRKSKKIYTKMTSITEENENTCELFEQFDTPVSCKKWKNFKLETIYESNEEYC